MSSSKLQIFTMDIVGQFGSKIVAILEFGSHRGEVNSGISDIDILILCKDKAAIPEIITAGRKFEKEIFNTVHSSLDNLLQRHFLGTNKLGGVHPMVLSRDELTRHFKPKSRRLRTLMSLLVGDAVLYYKLKNSSKLLYGQDFTGELTMPRASLTDRLISFSLPVVILLILPFSLVGRSQFIMWCCKAVKYFEDYFITYARIVLKNDHIESRDLNFNGAFSEIARKFRYRPQDYREGVVKFYFKCWLFLIRNTSFLFRDPGPKLPM